MEKIFYISKDMNHRVQMAWYEKLQIPTMAGFVSVHYRANLGALIKQMAVRGFTKVFRPLNILFTCYHSTEKLTILSQVWFS